MSQFIFEADQIQFSWNHRTQLHLTSSHLFNALSDVTVRFKAGEMIGLFGPNGSGKSTLMKLMSGVVSPEGHRFSGKILFEGQNFLSLPANQRAQRVTYVGPDIQTEFPLTAYELVSLGRTCRANLGSWSLFLRESQEDQTKIRWAMEECLCWSFKDRLVNTLSDGQRQLVALARGLAQGAKILFLDEVLSGMDLHHQILIGMMLKKLTHQGWTIILVSHDVNLVLEWADSAIFLMDGKKLFEGSTQENETLEKMKLIYPGIQLVLGKNPITGAPKVFFGA